MKVEILYNLVVKRAAHLLVYANADGMKNYQKIKALVLRDFQQISEACLENFLSARRTKNENHIQFASRLRANWDFHCELILNHLTFNS